MAKSLLLYMRKDIFEILVVGSSRSDFFVSAYHIIKLPTQDGIGSPRP